MKTAWKQFTAHIHKHTSTPSTYLAATCSH